MIVITIIAFLAAASIPSYLTYLKRATLTESITVFDDYKTALGVFWSTQGRLPDAGDTINSSPANLPFGTTVTADLPDSIESVLLDTSGNGIMITLVVGAGTFSTESENNRTLVLGLKTNGNYLDFECGNFATDAATATDVGFTNTGNLPRSCNYNGVGAWLSDTEEEETT